MRYIKTKRLNLRSWKPEDVIPYLKATQDNDVVQFSPIKKTIKEAREFARLSSASVNDRGFGLFAVERRDTKEFIGIAGIRVKQFDEKKHEVDMHTMFPCIELYVMLIKKYWNQGFATEALRGVIKFTEKKTDIRDLYAFVCNRNNPALNVVDKLGMQRIDTFKHQQYVDGHSKQQFIIYKLET
ncbi:GNAT family N-acetyltransferase [Phocicoccus pinnipedialis]|uniref:Acetyltransferase n=1 Tax=Phocicoccus pinnipedialis TaxID=110845 RepID=A0A6V7QZX6_9BACL|nr:GNAT family N-acetyltransferase [Jeotgalicoccus pinnipedialis]MBP1938734.1 RimJ/RimL family protein N-acetyltransferase [Jeotgalicoccus pinnipedialis]CAD2070566.1 Acetyltransferase [Jeotgalicoccus pinnipedialis]